MQIHLAKPGGERLGPYTLDQVNDDLAAKKYHDSDYWAWYDGAEAWVPLYSVPGIVIGASSTQSASSAPAAKPAPAPARAKEPQPKAPEPAADELASGMPFEALQQIFIFTTGEGPTLMKSPITQSVLQRIVVQEWAAIREKVPRDVFGRCDIGERLRQEGKVPDAAWRAMSALKPALIQQAKSGALRTCVRTFSIEDSETVAVFLFYGKQ
jgi:hypothetical protein